MRETRVTFPELALIAGTRAAIGAGLGLLLADRLPEGQRKGAGWTLLLLGALSTIPLALEVLGSRVGAPAQQPNKAVRGRRSKASDRLAQRDAMAGT